jgi:hypothetical protein
MKRCGRFKRDSNRQLRNMLWNSILNKETQTKMDIQTKNEKEKYDNPFERIRTEEDDFNDRDFDFITDEFKIKSKSKQNKPKAEEETKHKNMKVTFENHNASELAGSQKDTKKENYSHSYSLGDTKNEDELINRKIKELLNSEGSDIERDDFQEEEDHNKEMSINGGSAC